MGATFTSEIDYIVLSTLYLVEGRVGMKGQSVRTPASTCLYRGLRSDPVIRYSFLCLMGQLVLFIDPDGYDDSRP